MADLPLYIWALVLIGVIGIPATTVIGLFGSTVAADGNRRAAGIAAVCFAATWAGWIVVSALLAGDGAYHQSTSHNRPWIGVAAGGALGAALIGTTIPAVGQVLRSPSSLARLTLPHTFRVVGVAFIIVMALGKLPAAFALPAGLGDIAIGIAAPFIARRLASGDRTGATWFNILGILDLVVAVSIGFLAGLGPNRLLDISPSTAAVAMLPLALIPTTAVPLAVALHITSLIRLRTAPMRAPHTPAPAGLTAKETPDAAHP
ncbi:hypothetical protein DLE60_17025 [Micromonospora globispora]|uniref:hypothetical protein n=1 Tax=Micromonospora globispora TaxID=1450148 RepID=UPI000D6ED1D8|nr:hypothetical protein [Micromonospora globispora]PWU59328.1 hypothetical protein DLE60_17025 [Micromonospora globispora]